MARLINFLTLEQVLAIHHGLIEEFGGSHGIRDLNLLESAVLRPQASFMGEDLYLTVFDKAAAMAHSLILNHPFVDGNKRTGIKSAAGLLYLNGLELKLEQKELVSAALNIANKKWGTEKISSWLKKHSKKV